MAAAEEILIKVGVDLKELKKLQEATKKYFGSNVKKAQQITQRFARQQKLVNKLMTGQAQKLVNNATKINKLGNEHDRFFRVMGMSYDKWRQFNQEGGRFNKISSRAANRIRKFAHGMRGFRMEMLSVMFFGMGLQRFFSGLLKPALEAAGVFELLSSTLQILFMPIALAILEFLLPWIDKIMNMSDATKLWIGKIVLLGAALGTFLFLVGMLTLALGGMIMAAAGLFIIIDKLIPDIKIAGINMSSFIEMGLGITLITKAAGFLKDMLNGVLGALLEMDIVKELFSRLGITLDETKTPLENFKNLFRTTIEKVKNEIKKITGTGQGQLGAIPALILDMEKAWSKWSRFFATSSKIWRKRWEEDIQPKLDEFMESLDTLVKQAPSISTALKTIADAMVVLADAVKSVKDAWNEIKDPSIFKLFKGESTQAGPTPIGGLENLRDFFMGKRHIVTGEAGINAPQTVNITINTTGGIVDSDLLDLSRMLDEHNATRLANLSRSG